MTEFLLDWAIRSTLILALGLAAYGWLRSRSASCSHAVLAVTLVSAAMLPAIRPLVPVWRVPLSFAAREVSAGPALEPEAAATTLNLGTVPPSPAPDPADDIQAMSIQPAVPPAKPFPWIPVLAIAVPALLVLRRAVALAWMASRARRGRMSESLDAVVRDGSARLNLRRTAQARLFDQVVCPTAMTWGHFHPVVAMPIPAEQWPEGRLAGVLLHELAHAKRGDWLVQQTAGLAAAALWFQPLAWLAYRRLRSAAECAADELVLRVGVEPAAYAQYLLESIRAHPCRRSTFAFAGVDTMTDSHFETRIKSIISFGDRRRGSVRVSVLVAAGLAVAASFAVAAASVSGGGADPASGSGGGLASAGLAPAAGASQAPAKQKLEARNRELAEAQELRMEARRQHLLAALKKGRSLTAKQRKALVDLMEAQRAELKKLRSERALLKASQAQQASRFSAGSGAKQRALDEKLLAERLARRAEVAKAMEAANQGLAQAEREIERSAKEQAEQKQALAEAFKSVQSIDAAKLSKVLQDAFKQAPAGQDGPSPAISEAQVAELRAQLRQLESQKAQLRAQMELMIKELTQLMEKIYGNTKPQGARDKALSDEIREMLQHMQMQPQVVGPQTIQLQQSDAEAVKAVIKALEDAERNKVKDQSGTKK